MWLKLNYAFVYSWWWCSCSGSSPSWCQTFHVQSRCRCWEKSTWPKNLFWLLRLYAETTLVGLTPKTSPSTSPPVRRDMVQVLFPASSHYIDHWVGWVMHGGLQFGKHTVVALRSLFFYMCVHVVIFIFYFSPFTFVYQVLNHTFSDSKDWNLQVHLRHKLRTPWLIALFYLRHLSVWQFSEAGLQEWITPFVIFRARCRKRLHLPLLGWFLSRHCLMQCITMEVEPRIVK